MPNGEPRICQHTALSGDTLTPSRGGCVSLRGPQTVRRWQLSVT